MHLHVIQRNASKRSVQLGHLVHASAEGSHRRAYRGGKVVDGQSSESVGPCGRQYICKDAFEKL